MHLAAWVSLCWGGEGHGMEQQIHWLCGKRNKFKHYSIYVQIAKISDLSICTMDIETVFAESLSTGETGPFSFFSLSK